MFVATLRVVGASAGGRCCVALDQKGSAIAALRDQRDIVKFSCRSRTDANEAKSGRHVTTEDSCAPATRRHDGHLQSFLYYWRAGWQIILHCCRQVTGDAGLGVKRYKQVRRCSFHCAGPCCQDLAGSESSDGMYIDTSSLIRIASSCPVSVVPVSEPSTTTLDFVSIFLVHSNVLQDV